MENNEIESIDANGALAHIAKNVAEVRKRMARAAERSGRSPSCVTLVAVTKTRAPEEMAAAVAAGCLELGENRVQEYMEKLERVQHLAALGEINQKKPHIKWNMIGHLQTNKVKYIIGSVSLIHSVDSLRLAAEIEARAAAAARTVDVLIQVNAAGEAQKSGVSMRDAEALALEIAAGMPHVAVTGLMAVVPAVDSPEQARPYFRQAHGLFSGIAGRHGAEAAGGDGRLPGFARLSMGMTHDFEAAIEEGATIVRVGTGLFGARA